MKSNIYRISLNEFTKIIHKLTDSIDIFAPVNTNEVVNFEKLNTNSTIDFKTLKTQLSVKNLFFSQNHEIVKFKTENKNISIEHIENKDMPFIILGVKNCDFQALSLLDNVFLNDYKDLNYAQNRKNAIIMIEKCLNPLSTCFCMNFNINPLKNSGDCSYFICDNYLYLQFNTEKCLSYFKNFIGNFEIIDDKHIKSLEDKALKNIKKLPYNNLNLPKFTKENQERIFDSELWKNLSNGCLGCGSCTFSCPTCQCYNIKDIKTQDGAIRYRCWDSCMFSEFTKMAGGNPRPYQWQRFRQRFMHKLFYYPLNFKQYSCVGCGRCVKTCPMSLNIIKIIKKIGEELNE